MKKKFILYKLQADELSHETGILYLKEDSSPGKLTERLSEAKKVSFFTAVFYTLFKGFSFISYQSAKNVF